MDGSYRRESSTPTKTISLLPWRVRLNNNTIAAFETARAAGDYVQACGAPEGFTYENITIVFSNTTLDI